MINDLDIFCSFEKNYKNFRDDNNLVNRGRDKKRLKSKDKSNKKNKFL